MRNHRMRCATALSALESSILQAVAEGMAPERIAEIEAIDVDEVRYICARSVSKVRHPAFQSHHFAPEELAAARTFVRSVDDNCAPEGL